MNYLAPKLVRAVQHLWWNGAGITLNDRHTIAHQTNSTLDEVDQAIEFVCQQPRLKTSAVLRAQDMAESREREENTTVGKVIPLGL